MAHARRTAELSTSRLGVELNAARRVRVPNATTVFAIRDVAGRLVAEHVRIERPGGEKTFAWRRDGRSGLRGLRVTELPLYGADQVAAFDRSQSVVLCEGEKATDRLVSIGAQAVGSVTGAGSVPGPGPLGVLQGWDVVLWPDHNDDGARHMERIAAQGGAPGTPPAGRGARHQSWRAVGAG